MRNKRTNVQLLVLLAAAVCFNVFVQGAAACDLSHMLNNLKAVHQNGGAAQATKTPVGTQYGPPAPGNGKKSIVGMWQVSASYQGQLIDVYYDTWHADGNELFIDATNPIEDNVCQGVWVTAPANNYKLKHQSWYFDTTGTLLGWSIMRSHIQVGRDGNTFTGTANVLIYDTNGNLQVEMDGVVLEATRISVDF